VQKKRIILVLILVDVEVAMTENKKPTINSGFLIGSAI
jgi:hypothetical protein